MPPRAALQPSLKAFTGMCLTSFAGLLMWSPLMEYHPRFILCAESIRAVGIKSVEDHCESWFDGDKREKAT